MRIDKKSQDIISCRTTTTLKKQDKISKWSITVIIKKGSRRSPRPKARRGGKITGVKWKKKIKRSREHITDITIMKLYLSKFAYDSTLVQPASEE